MTHHQYQVHVTNNVSLSGIRSRARTFYVKNGEQTSAVTAVPVSDIPSSIPFQDVGYVDLYINEEPFYRSVSNCCQHVDNLSGHVNGLASSVATGSLSIAGAKAAAAMQIGNSLSNGFSKYIKYMISEKLALLKPKIVSFAATLDAAKKRLEDRQETLENDYQRITLRYSKIIFALQEQLEQRLHELDREAFAICGLLENEVFVDPIGCAFGQSACSGTEQLTTSDSVKVATLKTNAQNTMQIIEDQVLALRRLKRSIHDILLDHSPRDQHRFSMPAIRMESERLDAAGKNVRIFSPGCIAPQESAPAYKQISEGFSALPEAHKSEEEYAELDRFFQRHVSDWMNNHKDTDVRLLKCIRSMWENNKAKLNN